MALPAALMLFGPACSDDDGSNGTNGTQDAGATDATEDAGAPDAAADAGAPDTGPFECRFDQECPAGEVCNIITKACEPGRACTADTDCDVCSEVPLSSSEDCGHGMRLTAYCDENRFVCTRSRASCEPCETDADCGRIRFGNFLQVPNYCIDYSEVGPGLSGKFCARAARASAGVRGYELQPLGPERFGTPESVYVNPLGCPADPDDLFLCPIIDEDGDGRAEPNPECDDFESACIDDPCPGTGGQRCANVNLPGVTPICGDYCTDDSECPGSRPFCNPLSGVCQTGCSPGACPNEQVCHADGTCAAPCVEAPNPDETELAEADEFCVDEYGANTYCNVQSPRRDLPKLSKFYRDFGACAPLGCERGQGDLINRDCGGQEVCDISTINQDGLPEPSCVPGCFSGGDCTTQEPCEADTECPAERPWCQPNPNPGTPGNCSTFPLENPQVFRCVDAPSGQVDERQACREEFFTNGLDEENRDSDSPRIGTCCETGCITRNNDCIGAAAFCCEEQGSPYSDPASCRNVVQDDPNPIQATPGTCFEAPIQPFCQGCNPMDPFNSCNATEVEGLVDNPSLAYSPATVWPAGENQDCDGCSEADLDDYTALGGQVNSGTPFYEVQRCVNIDPRMGATFPVCTVGYDPAAVADAGSSLAAGVPRGWECAARAPPCVDDSQCNGLTCVGFEALPDGTILSLGACQCGEDGVPTTACPDTINGIPMISGTIEAPTRMRCVEAKTPNYQGPQSPDVANGDMFCVYTFDCAPPTLQVPDWMNDPENRTTPQTLPDACGIPAAFDDPTD